MNPIEKVPAALMLEDGTFFSGISCGAPGEATGTVCFNTAMIGYPEVLSNPANAGRIMVMSYPQIGNYGIAQSDLESKSAAVWGLVVRDICQTPSNFRSDMSLPEYLVEQGIVALCDVDTRALVRHISEHGAMRAAISTIDLDPASLLAKAKAAYYLEDEDLIALVSTKTVWTYDPVQAFAAYGDWAPLLPQPRYNVVAIDCGITNSALRQLVRAGCAITVVPWDTTPEEIVSLKPDGVFISSGPGDPRWVQVVIETNVTATNVIATVAALLGNVPVFGVGLGHQLIALAACAAIEKLRHEHNGNNQPVCDLNSHTIDATEQCHMYAACFDTLGQLIPEESGGVTTHPLYDDLRFWMEKGVAPVVQNEQFGRIRLTHINVNDGTAEGLRFLDIPAQSVQFNPVVAVDEDGPHPLYREFTKLMDAFNGQVGNPSTKEADHA